MLFAGIRIEELLLYSILMTPVIELHHSNIRLPETADRILRTLIPTPLLHRIHHSVVEKEHDSNYGSMLSVWDRIFGSFRTGPVTPVTPLGLPDDSGTGTHSLGTLLGRPFRTREFSG
jgi:sterol desaturase/sphingolipid hydroxylase (fatty acid hydroxylase superfamily)